MRHVGHTFMGRTDKIYARLPVWAQHAAVSAFGLYWNRLRFGGRYPALVQEYRERDRWSRERWAVWQAEQLRELLAIAGSHVPYYRDTWSPAERRAADEGDLGSLPLLSKQPVRANARAFVREDHRPRREHVFHTSGSTGTPIATIWTTDEYRDAMAVREVRSAGWANVSFSMPRATFHGRMVVPDPDSRGPYYRFNIFERQVYLSAFHLRRETAADYVAGLRRHGIRWLTGYAVSYYVLAQFILELGLDVPPLDAVITTSEKVMPHMRETMERAYGCPVFEEYSTVENAAFASECEHGSLHVSPDWGVVEILRPDGNPCMPDEPGEVVTTCLRRAYQPMIRFRLGDVATWDPRPCLCGRGMPVLKEIVGRIEDVIIGPDGRRIAQFYGVFADLPNVREGQIVQHALDRITVRVVPATGYGPGDATTLTTRMRQRLGEGIAIEIETVASIPRHKSGKFQQVVSHLAKQNVAGAERTGVD